MDVAAGPRGVDAQGHLQGARSAPGAGSKWLRDSPRMDPLSIMAESRGKRAVSTEKTQHHSPRPLRYVSVTTLRGRCVMSPVWRASPTRAEMTRALEGTLGRLGATPAMPACSGDGAPDQARGQGRELVAGDDITVHPVGREAGGVVRPDVVDDRHRAAAGWERKPGVGHAGDTLDVPCCDAGSEH